MPIIGLDPSQQLVIVADINEDLGIAPDGLVKDGIVDQGSPIFILPEGFRPQYRVLLMGMTSPNVAGRVDIMPDGRVLAMRGVNSEWLSLDGLSFSTY